MTTATKTQYRVTAVHMVGTEHHQHISEMRWVKDGDQASHGSSSRAEMVDYVRRNPNTVYATDRQGDNAAWLHVVNGDPPYVQTKKDGVLTNNLLSLPRY